MLFFPRIKHFFLGLLCLLCPLPSVGAEMKLEELIQNGKKLGKNT
jgi:hypothetical protein